MHERDALAAKRRRMPWMAVEKTYEFDGPTGKVTLLDLFEELVPQLILYRAFFEPGVIWLARARLPRVARWVPDAKYPTWRI